MADVFVSYASPDREPAFRIVEFLESNGVSCWVAPRDVSPGMEYGEAIISGIENSRALVLVLSEESNNSQFVRKEVERAVSKVKPVLPVRIREVSPAGSLEFFISSAQWIDAFRTPMESHLLPLLQAIKGIAGDGTGAPVRSSAAPLVRHGNQRRNMAVTGLGLLVFAAAAWGFLSWREAAARSDIAFVVGSWCQRSDQYQLRFDIVRTGPDTVQGNVHHSHSSTVGEFKSKVKAIAGGFEFEAIAGDAKPGDVVRFRVVDDRTLLLTFEEGEARDGPPRVRCNPSDRL